MLGKRPCLLRTSSSRSLLIPCEETEEESTTFCNDVQVTEKNHRPALSSPCKIVIGFDIGAEKNPYPDVCESPRSVLDTVSLLPSQEKHHIAARSPRSGLGSLLTASSETGVGLELVAQVQDKEEGVHAGSAAGSFKATLRSPNCSHETCPDKMSLSLKSSHCYSRDTGLLGKASNSDFMDADSPPQQRQAPCVLCVEDEILDCDISPRRSRAMFMLPNQGLNANFTGTNQSRALDACLSNDLKGDFLDADADTLPQCSDPWQIGTPHVNSMNVTNNEHIKAQVLTWQSGSLYGPGSKGAVNGRTYDHTSSRPSDALSVCEDECTGRHITPWQRQALHQVSMETESEEISIRQSIFSAASPPCFSLSLITSSSGFLKVCSFCGHSLRLGKDIFMYRGDQAFCSAECRYQKIVLDEGKAKQGG